MNIQHSYGYKIRCSRVQRLQRGQQNEHHSSNKTNTSTMSGSVPELNKKTQHNGYEHSAACMLAKQEVNFGFLVSFTFNIANPRRG